ncbi:MAG TPA: hypothetical protein VGV35_06060 [Bryobacteraceae bacterium]|nr:hypothetical protein [Bryobacteraceae bacterium]
MNNDPAAAPLWQLRLSYRIAFPVLAIAIPMLLLNFAVRLTRVLWRITAPLGRRPALLMHIADYASAHFLVAPLCIAIGGTGAAAIFKLLVERDAPVELYSLFGYACGCGTLVLYFWYAISRLTWRLTAGRRGRFSVFTLLFGPVWIIGTYLYCLALESVAEDLVQSLRIHFPSLQSF